MKQVGIYLRVSTDSQTTDNQRMELEAVAARSEWDVVGFYEDAGSLVPRAATSGLDLIAS
jgi:DNA invertase Pin-like site-specific DNA recombinase